MGYHFGVLLCAYTAVTVTVINLAFLIWAISKSGLREDLGTLQDGNCGRIQKSSLWIHLAINVLSTILLSASNYTMQCLSSPTRNEIDKAHGHGIWLDVGVPSFRNLRKISRYRVTLWWILALSSIPLHLLYNSAIFASLSSREFNVFVVSSDFPDGAPFNASIYGTNSQDPSTSPARSLQEYQKNQKALSKLENEACRNIYGASLIAANADVILVTSTENSTDSLFGVEIEETSNLVSRAHDGFHSDSDFFSDCVPDQAQNPLKSCITPSTAEWSIPFIFSSSSPETQQLSIQYCLSQPVPEQCKLQFSLAIMIVVIICNIVKAVCMGLIAWKGDPEPLVTLGDAISSFLNHPDKTTQGNCASGKTRFIGAKSWDPMPSVWDPRLTRWFHTASKRRWLVCNILSVNPDAECLYQSNIITSY